MTFLGGTLQDWLILGGVVLAICIIGGAAIYAAMFRLTTTMMNCGHREDRHR